MKFNMPLGHAAWAAKMEGDTNVSAGVPDMDNAWGDLRAHWSQSHEREKAERQSWMTVAMQEIHALCKGMQEVGWLGIGRYPNQGETVLCWDPLQPPYRCRYDDGKWWALMDGDMWPAHPVLWRPMPPAPEKEAGAI